TMEDAYRVLGWLHAQDRMFQMEMNRRVGAGRLAEILGSSVLGVDRLMRVLDLYRAAEDAVADMAPGPKLALDAYADGVNSWLAQHDGPNPPELMALGIDPEPWKAADSVVWGMLMALQLSDNWRTEITRARIAERLSPDQLADLWPPADPNGSTTLAANFGAYCCRNKELFAGLADVISRPGAGIFALSDASNEWVVSGAHTATGAPLLANDPHLGFSAPLLWYLTEIVTPALHLTGVTVPGVPLLLLGHNGHIAWGFTTTHADVQDLFIERVDPADPLRYLTPDGSAPFELRRETIFVRGRDEPESLTVRTTRHGPIISDISEDAAGVSQEGELIALAFTALAAVNKTTEALYDLNRATDWTEFTAALENFHAPVQNIVYADTSGHIGFYVSGRLPVRAAGDGTLPVPGWTGQFDWTGFVPFAEMPHRLDPRAGRIVNANNRVVDGNYPYLVTADWPDAQRADRINELLDVPGDATVDRFAAIQTDIVSLVARELLPMLLEMAGNMEARGEAAGEAAEEEIDPLAAEAVRRLAAWDATMDRELPEPLIFTGWLTQLGLHLYGDELGSAAQDFLFIRPRVLSRMLGERHRESHQWCDDVGTSDVEDCPTIVRAALVDALARLADEAGDDLGKWRWGDFHRARFSHQIFGRVPGLRSLVDIVIETDGGDFTVNRGTHMPPWARDSGDDFDFTHLHGAGYRAVYDLGDLANSRMIIATGQSGHPLSRHFGDLTSLWRDGAYLQLGRRRTGENGFPASIFTFLPAP
ncbi:MAG: penicillin acylase family protein, partial [Alphaproteobacteria bacterium]|nr:penicillin acylase family protein [Alphaproteobacteria bacterium]